MSKSLRAAAILAPLAIAMYLVTANLSMSRGATWNSDSDGNWSDGTKWTGGIPNATDATADFSTLDISSDHTVTLDGNFTVGTLLFGDIGPTNNWIINPASPSNTLTLDVSSGSALINVANPAIIPTPLPTVTPIVQSATINAVIAGNDGLTKAGPGTLILTAQNTYTGATSVKFGALNLDFSPSTVSSNILSSSSTLSLGGGLSGLTGGTLNIIGKNDLNVTNSQTFASTAIDFGNNIIAVNQNGAGTVNVSLNAVSRTNFGSLNLRLPTSGNISATSATIPNVNGIIGGWATVGVGSSASWATNSGGNIVPLTTFDQDYSAGGTAVSNSSANVRFAGGNLAMPAGSLTDLNSILTADAAAHTISFAAGTTLRLGAHGGIFRTDNTADTTLTVGSSTTSNLTAGGAPNTDGELVLDANNLNAQNLGIAVTGPVVNNGTGVVTLVKTGFGTAQLNVAAGATGYTGGTYINQGKLRAQAGGAWGTGSVYVASGAQAFLNTGSFSNNFFIAGKGFYEGSPQFSSGAIRMGGSSVVISGTITLLSDALISARGAGTAAATATISGKITGSFGIELGANASTQASMILSNAGNDYVGDTTISTGIVRPGVNDVFPHGVGKGNLIINGTTDSGVTNNSILDLNNHSVTVNGFSSAGNAARTQVTSSVAGAVTLTVGDNNASSAYGGIIQNGTGTVALSKIGTGTQTLSGANTYTGGTSIQNGTLKLGASNTLLATGAVTLGSGTTNTSGILDLNGFSPSVGGLSTAGTGTANIVGNSSATLSTLTFATGTTTFGGKIQDTLPGGSATTALTVSSGSLTLGGNSTFTGGTTVNGGLLAVTGSLVAANTTHVIGGTLGGNGNGSTTGLAGTISVEGGTVRPGAVAGDIATLAVSSLTVHSGGVTIDLGPSLTSDVIKSLGALTVGDLSGPIPTFTVAGTPAAGNYEVIDYSDALTRNVDFNVTGPVGFGYSLNYATPNKVFLNVAAVSTTLTWKGTADQTSWDTSHANFNNGSSAVVYSEPSHVIFDDTSLAGATTVNITNTVSPVDVLVNASARNYTFQGADISGTGTTLTKQGSSTLTILNNNTYTGTTTISGGAIQVGNGGSTGALGTGAITDNATLTYNRSDTVTLTNAVSGTGTLQQSGGGTLILAGTNSYGATNITAGTLQVGDATTNGTLGLGNVTVTNSGILSFNRTDVVTVGNSVALNSASAALQQNGTGTTKISGNITGAGSVQVNTGILQLSGTNSYGNTTVGGGATLQIGGGTSGTLGNGTLTNNGTVAFNRSDALVINSALGGGGNYQQLGSGTTTFNAANTYTGTTIVSGGTLAIGNASALNTTAGVVFGNLPIPVATYNGYPLTGSLDLSTNSATIASLTVNSNSANNNTIIIGSGKSLTVNGPTIIGGLTAANGTDNPISNLVVTGSSGTLTVNNDGGVLIVGNNKVNNTGGGDTINAKLDLSGLGTFTANMGTTGVIAVGAGFPAGTGSNAPWGKLILGTSNILTAATMNVGINTGGGNASNSSVLLGTTNAFNIDTINIGAGKTQASPTGSISFNTGLTNPTLTLRGAAGGLTRMTQLNVGANYLQTANGSGSGNGGTLDLTAGSVDALITDLRVGVGSATTGLTGTSTGTLNFSAGTIDTNTLAIGVRGTSGPVVANVTLNGPGTLQINGGTITGTPNVAIKIADTSVGTAGTVTGTLTINGGSVNSGADALGGGGTSNINLNSGTLNLQTHNVGAVGTPVTSLTFQTGHLTGFTNLTVGSISGTGGDITGANVAPPVTLTVGNATTNSTTFGGIIKESGTGKLFLTKTGTSTQILSGANTYTGDTKISAGVLQLGAANSIAAVSNLVLDSGTFGTGGFNQTFNTPLVLTSANSTIDLGSGASTVHFATSDIASLWGGNSLAVSNWTVNADHLFFGSTGQGLGSSVVNTSSQINFTNHPLGARILSTGEVLPTLSVLKGDFNQDGSITGADINAMLQALSNVSAYEVAYAMSPTDISNILDFTNDGKLTNLDIQGELDWVATHGGGSIATVPEPASLLLFACGGVALAAYRARRNHK